MGEIKTCSSRCGVSCLLKILEITTRVIFLNIINYIYKYY